MERRNRSNTFRFSVFAHNFWQIFKRLFWIPILLALLLGLWRWKNLTAGFVPVYKAASTYRVVAGRSAGTDVSSYGYYLDSSTATSVAASFHYAMHSDKAAALLRERSGRGSLSADVKCRAETTLLIFESTGSDPESVYNALLNATAVFPEAAKGIAPPFTLETFEEPVLPRRPVNEPNASSSSPTSSINFRS